MSLQALQLDADQIQCVQALFFIVSHIARMSGDDAIISRLIIQVLNRGQWRTSGGTEAV